MMYIISLARIHLVRCAREPHSIISEIILLYVRILYVDDYMFEDYMIICSKIIHYEMIHCDILFYKIHDMII